MRQTSELFELIKSMDKNEKRYFRLQSLLQKGNKNYLKLFNAIDNQRIYDERKIKEKHKDEKFVKQYAFTKNYLYNLIIKSLINYRSEKSIDCRIHSAISECKILFSKALYRQYFYKISKAKQLCLKYERYGYFLQILDMEKIIIKKEEIQTLKSEEIYNEALSALERLRNIFEYYRLAAYSLHKYRASGTIRDKKLDDDISKILSSAIMQKEDSAISIRSKDAYYRINEIIYNTTADYKKMLGALEKRYNIVINNPHPFEDYIIDYQSDILSSLANVHLNQNNIDEAEKYLEKYENIKIETESDRADSDIFASFTRFRICIKKDEIYKASKLITKLEGFLEKYKNKLLIDTELSVMFHIVKCRILEKNFDKALKAANLLMAHPFLEKRSDFESYLKIMNLIIHFELKNYPLLKYLIISTYRYLYNKQKLYKLETLLLRFIRKLPEVKSDDDLIYTFIQFKKELVKLKNNEYEKNAFEYFDFLKWVEEKIPD